ncbi:hypothetical protein Adt_23514 [Abeliophyllum distichum]|uniref:Uncharacterized protein n=1 Tax=Abeliophyllum distichum TaxID=126358 RepID=A0ABD1SEE2_9LAMI
MVLTVHQFELVVFEPASPMIQYLDLPMFGSYLIIILSLSKFSLSPRLIKYWSRPRSDHVEARTWTSRPQIDRALINKPGAQDEVNANNSGGSKAKTNTNTQEAQEESTHLVTKRLRDHKPKGRA